MSSFYSIHSGFWNKEQIWTQIMIINEFVLKFIRIIRREIILYNTVSPHRWWTG